MQAHSSLVRSYIARRACIHASSLSHECSFTNECIHASRRPNIYIRIQTRAECDERNLGDRTLPEPTLSLDQPEQRCHSLPDYTIALGTWSGRQWNQTLWPARRQFQVIFGLHRHASTLVVRLFVYRSLCLYACLIVYHMNTLSQKHAYKSFDDQRYSRIQTKGTSETPPLPNPRRPLPSRTHVSD